MIKIERTADRSLGVSTTSRAMGDVFLAARLLRDQAKNPCPRKMPQTIMMGAGDISTMVNGARGPASRNPQSVMLLAPRLMSKTAEAARAAPIQSRLTLDRPLTGL